MSMEQFDIKKITIDESVPAISWFTFFFRKGIISSDVYSKLSYFQAYKYYREKGHKKMDAYEFAAITCKVSDRTIRRVVKEVMFWELTQSSRPTQNPSAE